MNNNRKKFINNYAKLLLETLDISVPFCEEEIVAKLGGRIERINDFNSHQLKDGKIEKEEDGSFIITLNQFRNTKERMKFSFAHELGHLFLHMSNSNSNNNVMDSTYYRYGGGLEEREANEFAGAFLMPDDNFRDIAESNKVDDYYIIPEIAKHFEVSHNAVIIRGRNLGFWE